MNYDNDNLLEFMKSHTNWEEIITNAPYNVKVKHKGDLVHLKYSQIDTKICHLTNQCRSPIIDVTDFSYVKRPFYRFLNYGQEGAAEIDWATAWAEEKLDGSLIALYWYKDEWHVCTSGTFDAEEAELTDNHLGLKNFRELFDYTLQIQYGMTLESMAPILNSLEDFTILFEMVTPINRVVVPVEDYRLYYLRSIHEWGGNIKMWDFESRFHTPATYKFGSVEDYIKEVESYDWTKEGFVICDYNNNRVKLKGQNYIFAHRLKGEGAYPTPKRVLDIIRIGEQAEILAYFPEYKPYFDKWQERHNNYKRLLEAFYCSALTFKDRDRKDFAKIATKSECPSLYFLVYDNKVSSSGEYLDSIPTSKLVDILERMYGSNGNTTT